MGTIIDSVAFENLYCYYGSYIHNEYKFKTGVNIILIKSGQGKTTFCKGIVWLLYNKVPYCDGTGFKDADASLMEIVSKKVKGENNNFKVGVKVDFTNGDEKYTIERFALFTRINGVLSHDKSKIIITEHKDNNDIPVLDEYVQYDILNRKFIPISLRSYVLLYGERMDLFLNLSSKDSFSYILDTVTNSSVLNRLCNISEKMVARADELFQIKFCQNYGNSSAAKELLTQHNLLTHKIQSTLEEIEHAKDTIYIYAEKKENLDLYIRRLNHSNNNEKTGNMEDLKSNQAYSFINLENEVSYIDNLNLNKSEIISTYNALKRQIKLINKEISDKKKMIINWKITLDLVEKGMIAYIDECPSVQKYKEFATLMKQISEVFKQTQEYIFDKTISSVTVKANEKYKALTLYNPQLGSRLVFERHKRDVRVMVRDKKDRNITDVSLELQAMKQLSIVMAIILTKNRDEETVNIPIIFDEPFNYKSDKCVNNFFNAVPTFLPQTIVLTTAFYDRTHNELLTTIGRNLLADMKRGKLSGTFYLHHRENDGYITIHPLTSHIC